LKQHCIETYCRKWLYLHAVTSTLDGGKWSGLQSWSEHFGEEKNFMALPGIEFHCSVIAYVGINIWDKQE
jgi:hypothetical protein